MVEKLFNFLRKVFTPKSDIKLTIKPKAEEGHVIGSVTLKLCLPDNYVEFLSKYKNAEIIINHY